MIFSFRSNSIGARLVAATVGAMALLGSAATLAQSSVPAGVSDEVIDVLLESRSQKPASQATPTERAAAVDELANIYAVTDLPAAIEMGKEPRLAAQLDLQRRAILFNAFATDYLAKNQPSDQEIFDTYQEQVLLAPPLEYKARHILVDSQGEALSLIKQLQDGAEFSELAKEHSTGPSGPSGGDLGWFPANAMVKAFSDAVVALEDGGITQAPVQTQFGWHVILREESRESTPPPLESVRDVIVQRVSQEKFLEFVRNLRAKDEK
ncbi:MAG TPA: peptidylprolyl isomerase [Woeseiaceae bacterium]|nr:peptidylprolyl isomerase [Woeseiaceae bacterium]